MTEVLREKHETTKERITQIFRFLQALDHLRNPVQRQIGGQLWNMWMRDLPEHPSIVVGSFMEQDETDLIEGSDSAGGTAFSDDILVKVQRPELKGAPHPPEILLAWLENGWQKIEGTVRIIDSKTTNEKDEDGNPILVTFDEDAERVRLFREWNRKREEWVVTEKPAYQAMSIFERLYSLHSRMERESEQIELILGDGLLNWDRAEGGSIHHPILLQRVQLTFDPSGPEFTITNTDKPVELYTALFRSVSSVSGNTISGILKELDEGAYHPFGGERTTDFLKRIITQLSPHGKLIENENKQNDKSNPSMKREPVLFLRKRNLGFSTAIEWILEDIPNQTQFSETLSHIVGVSSSQSHSDETKISIIDKVNGEDEVVLLTKDANTEQLEIAQRLEKYGSVLVQGPPGTGKTHTIANLLGHLLAQGKSVLVTSHTTKALKVLRDKVIEPLQPLCVSVLDNDVESRHQLEGSIDVITERLASLDPDVLEREAALLNQERSRLLQQLRETRERLKFARQDEYRPVVIAGEQYDPAQAARIVAANEAADSWIPSPVSLGEPLPLSHAELADLYHTNVHLTSEEEKELAFELPDPADLMAPSWFERIVSEREQLSQQDLEHRKDLWAGVPEEQSPEELQDLLKRLHTAIELLQDEAEWRMTMILAGREGETLRQVWDELLEEVERVYQLSVQTQPHMIKYAPEVPNSFLNQQTISLVDEISDFLKNGGKLTSFKLLFKSQWKQFVQSAKINGSKPEALEHFEAVRSVVALQNARAELLRRWERQVSKLNGPAVDSLGHEPEKVCRHMVGSMVQSLDWYDKTWMPLEQELIGQGFDWSSLLQNVPTPLVPHAELLQVREAVQTHIPDAIHAQCHRLAWTNIETFLSELKGHVEKAHAQASQSEIVNRLVDAVHRLDPVGYREVYDALVDLHSQHSMLKQRRELLSKLEKVAPVWAAAIRNREGIHGQGILPGDPNQAWLWRQMHDELEQRAKTSLEELQNKIVDLSKHLRRVTGALVEKKAWAAQVRRTSLSQRQALLGWKALNSRIGAGTGKRAPIFRAEARKLMPQCQKAVPVWIMPINRVVENYDPQKNKFDVVIIDEANQSDAMALTALYLGKQVVVVGDDKQVSPEAVGQRVEEVFQLIDTFLKEIPNKHLYDGISSIYDIAKTCFAGMVQLREHFRSVPDIIRFSNNLSYEGKVLPLRDPSKIQRKPYTVAYRIEGATSNDKVNEKEALTVASLLMAAAEQLEYKDTTFGVISMVGDDQAMKIDALLRQYMSPKEYNRRLIRCGNSAQFQGDERDVMFLSMVDASKGEGPLSMRSDERFKKRFNVAASRARDQMWVVHSLDPEVDVKPGDLRRRLIQHAQNPKALTNVLSSLEERTESEFEKQVLARLVRTGYRVIPQWQVGGYRMDMVVEGGGKRLAVECDGDKWHPHEKLEQDMARQAILERLGWKFVRIRGSQFFRNPDNAMEPVFKRLQDLEIPMEGLQLNEESLPNDHELKERIIQRAAELRAEWSGETGSKELEDNIEFPDISLDVNRESILNKFEDEVDRTNQMEPFEHPQDADVDLFKENEIVMSVEDELGKSEPVRMDLQETKIVQDVLDLDSNTTPDSSKKLDFFHQQKEQQFDLVSYLNEKGLEVIDKRKNGGSLWVVGGQEISPILEELRSRRIRFIFAKNGGRATKNRPAWFTTYKG